MRIALLCALLHGFVVCIIAAKSFLVRRNDVNALFKPAGITSGHCFTSRAVDNDGMRQMVGVHVTFQTIEIEFLARLVHVLVPGRQPDSAFTQQHLFGTCNRAHPEIEIEVVYQTVALPVNLLQQRAANRPRTDEADGNRLGR